MRCLTALLFAGLAGLVTAQTNIVWETNAVGQVVRQDRFDRFRRSNGGYYAWVEVPTNLLAVTVPSGAHPGGQIYDESGTNVVRQKTMAEFLMPPIYAVNTNLCIVQQAHMESPTLRAKRPTRTDLLLYEQFYYPHGLAVSNWLDAAEFRTLKSAPRYTGIQPEEPADLQNDY